VSIQTTKNVGVSVSKVKLPVITGQIHLAMFAAPSVTDWQLSGYV